MIETIIALFFAIGFPLVTWPVYMRRRPALQSGDWAVKRREYAETILWLSAMGIVPTVLWLASGRSFELLGLSIPWSWQNGLALLVAAGFSILLALQVRTVRRDSEAREATRAAMAPVAEYLPRSAREARWFRGVSLAAGIGEEIFYRGFLLWYLAPLMPWIWAVVVSSVLFGFAHIMHGAQAALRATFMGAALALLYLFGGSLLAPMIVHTAVDLSSGEMGLAALEES